MLKVKCFAGHGLRKLVNAPRNGGKHKQQSNEGTSCFL